MSRTSRREFLRRSSTTAVAAVAAGDLFAQGKPADKKPPPSERVRLGIIGVGGRGAANLAAVSACDIVALCDVDANHLGAAKAKFPEAKAYADYRRVMDHKDIDGVVISTPDHMHAFPAVAAMRSGKDVYCEKPLGYSVYECRVMANIAAQTKRVTQMGIQIHAGENYHRVVEIIRAGVIGPVKRVFCWCQKRPSPGKRADPSAPGMPPAHLNYDLWLGPAPYRPYHESHVHFNWRWWWDFGGGVLADMGCHYMDLPFWALELKHPASIAANGKKEYQGDNDVPSTMQVDFEFGPRAGLPACRVTWFHGGRRPPAVEKNPTRYSLRNGKDGAPEPLADGVLFVGDEGELLADYSAYRLLPQDKFADVKLPDPSLPRSIGHHREWLEAIKSRGKTGAGFDYAGPLTECVLLGNCAYRAAEFIAWDAERLRTTNSIRASYYVQPNYRPGWILG